MTENTCTAESAPNAVGRFSRSDLHLHSRHSDRPSEWFLRRVGAPESFMAPQAVYDACKKAGMDYVTISDHNVIDGALEIAHHLDAFVSCELTTYFPDNGSKVHVLVHGITESQFRMLDESRQDIRALRDVLLAEDICHSVAHPMFRVNDRLTADQLEQLLLLFNRFEVLNGSRNPRGGDILRAVVSGLTPELMAAMAERHGIEPLGEKPWIKTLTGGSDDHGGLYIAGAYTETPPAKDVQEFLQHIREGRCQPGGQSGGSVHLANSLYRIAYSYYCERLLGAGQRDGTVLGAMLRTLGGESPKAAAGERQGGIREYARKVVTGAVKRHRQRRLQGVERLIAEEVQSVVGGLGDDKSHRNEVPDPERIRRTFQIVQRLSHRFLERGLGEFGSGDILGGMQSLSSLGMVALGVAPYLTATASQHKDADFHKDVAGRFQSAAGLRERSGGMAWITDTLTDINGVSHTISTLATLARSAGKPITVLSSPRVPIAGVPYDLVQFPPLGTFKLPEYKSIELSFPPFLEILHFLEQRQFSALMISTPGPLGLCALAAARLLGLKARGIYHTDFPAMADGATDDPKVGDAARSYMRWFYGQMEKVYVPTQAYVEHVADLGISRERVEILPRGVDLLRFNPRHADRSVWSDYHLEPERFKFLYVGRISRDKNVETLLQAHHAMSASCGDSDLIVVGDGPQRAELESRYGGASVTFTGTLKGPGLSRVYASADAFVFPSRTDTFGNVVLEAHASGLPAVVSDCGGPQEIVSTHRSGLVVDTRDFRPLADAMRTIQDDTALRESFRAGAMQRALESRWESVLAKL